MQFIRLTDSYALKYIQINTNHISVMEPYYVEDNPKAKTKILLNNGQTYIVKETIEDILKIISGVYLGATSI